MDIAAMRALSETHGVGEMTRDWDKALGTMTGDAIYRFFPYRLELTGAEAMIELWSRFFPEDGPLPCFDYTNRIPDAGQMKEFLAEDALLRNTAGAFIDPDGVRRGSSHVTRFDFRDGLIAAEIVFFDATFMHWIDGVFDEEFRSLPGVVQL